MALDFPNSPTNGQLYTSNNVTWEYNSSTTTWDLKQDGTLGTSKVATVKDVKAYNVQGGGFPAATWVHRDLNTLSDPQNIGLSISGNIVTVPAGTYSMRWRAPAYWCGRFTSRLAYSTTSSTIASGITYVDGTTSYDASGDNGGLSQIESFGDIASITFTSITYLKIEQYSETGRSGDTGLGVDSNINASDGDGNAVDSVYTTLQIEDLATAVKNAGDDYVSGTTKVAILRDQKDYNRGGGHFYGDYWRDRDLTVKEDPQGFVNFVPTANGQTNESAGKTPGYWSLPAGTYEIQWGAGGYDVNRHQTRLVWSTTQSDMTWSSSSNNNTADNPPNTTSRFGTNECFGSSENGTHESQGAWAGAWSTGTKIITITQTTYFKVLHISDTSDSEGFGTPVDNSNFGSDRYTTGKNIYAEVRITDLATAVKTSSNNLLNVWHVQKTDIQTISGTPAWTDITGLSQTVTSTTATTKFLITATVNASMAGTEHDGFVRLMRGTTVIGSTSSESGSSVNATGFGQVSGQNSQYETNTLAITYLDTPGVGDHIYHIEGRNNNAGVSMILNRRGLNSDFYMVSHMSIQRYT